MWTEFHEYPIQKFRTYKSYLLQFNKMVHSKAVGKAKPLTEGEFNHQKRYGSETCYLTLQDAHLKKGLASVKPKKQVIRRPGYIRADRGTAELEENNRLLQQLARQARQAMPQEPPAAPPRPIRRPQAPVGFTQVDPLPPTWRDGND